MITILTVKLVFTIALKNHKVIHDMNVFYISKTLQRIAYNV